MSTSIINVGVIGYGLSAKIFHIPFINASSKFRLAAIVQRRPTGENDAAKNHPDATIYQSVDELMQDADIHLVVVTTAPESHFQLAKAAIEAKKHVLVEKPFTPTLAEASRLVSLAQQHSVLLTVYQNRRYDSDFVTLSQHIKAGSLGRIVEFETHFDRHKPDITNASSWKYQPQPGTGVIYDLGSHLMDQSLVLFGMPKAVTGFLVSQRDHNPTGLKDSCTVLLHYDGLLVTVKAGVVSPEVDQLRYWVRGTRGSWKKCHLDVQEEQLHAGLRPGGQGYGVEPEDRHAVLNTADEGGKIASQVVATVSPPPTYTAFYDKLGEALEKGDEGALPVGGKDAVDLIRLIEAVQKSSEEGRTVAL